MKYLDNSPLEINLKIDNNGKQEQISIVLLIQAEIDQFIPSQDFILNMKDLRNLNIIYSKIQNLNLNFNSGAKSIQLENSEHELLVKLNEHMRPRFLSKNLRDSSIELDMRLTNVSDVEEDK